MNNYLLLPGGGREHVLDVLPDGEELVVHDGVPLLALLVRVHVRLQVPHQLVRHQVRPVSAGGGEGEVEVGGRRWRWRWRWR